MKKHIIIPELFSSGGSNKYLETLIQYLGPENTIVVLESSEDAELLANITNKPIETRIIELYPYANLKYKLTTNIKQLWLLLNSIFKILFLSISNRFAPVTISIIVAEKYLYLFWLPLIKVYYVLHSEPPDTANSNTIKTCNLRLGDRKKIVTVSNYMKQMISDHWHINDNKAQFVRRVYNCTTYAPIVKKRRTLVADEEKIILTLGHVEYRKNPFLWFKVAEKVCEINIRVKFIWLGDGPHLSELSQRARGYERIEFVGFISNPTAFFERASIYYQPSLIEPQGISVLEAMAYQLPCVVSNTGGLPESIQNNYSGLLVNPENVDEHVNAILRLLDRPLLSTQYGQNGYIKYQEAFSYKVFKQCMDALYYN